MSSQFFSLNPSNHPANNKVTFSGVPLINFTIHQNPSALVQGSSIRLNGKLTCKNGSSTIASNKCNLDERLGVYSLFDKLSISLLSNSQIVEEIKFYNRFLSSLTAVTQSKNQILTSSNATNLSVVSQGSACDICAENDGTGDDKTEQYFSITLPCGLMSSQVPLQHGLVISLSLVPDQQAFRSDADITPTYELSDLHLSGTMITETKPPTQFMYNSISSYYSVINSAFSTLNFNLGLSNAIGAWVTFIPSENTNNYLKNGTRNLPVMKSATEPATIRDLQFLMNGVKVALQYEITDEHADQTLFNSQIMKNFISAIKNFSDLTKTNVSPNNTNLVESFSDTADKEAGDFVSGVGVKLDSYSDQGMNTVGGNFTIQFTTDKDTDYANSAYMFVHSRNMVQFNDVGIQVLN